MSEKFLKLLLILLILSSPLGQLGRLPIGDSSTGIYVSDILLGFFNIAALLYFLVIRRRLQVNMVTLLGFAFLVWALVTWLLGTSVLSGTQSLISVFYLVRLFLVVLFFALVWSLKKLSPAVTSSLTNWLVFSGWILAIAGFVQLVIFPDFGRLDPALGWDPHYFRLNSTFFDPNFTGAYLVICFSLVLSKIKKQTWFWYLVALTLIVAIVLTFSRSAWLMLAIVIFIYGLFESRLVLLVSLLVAFGAYFAVPRVQTRLSGITDPADSAQFRLISWRQGLILSSKNRITGVGFNSLRYAREASEFYEYRPGLSTHSGAGFDSSLLTVLATTGIPGLLLFLLFLGSIFIGIMRGTVGNEKKYFQLLVASQFLALLVESNFINSLFYAPIMVLEFSILGLFVD